MFKRISILSIAVIFLLITTSAFAGTVQLPQTGQTKCYRGVSPYDEIPCSGTGQDGEIRAGAPWPDPRFTITYCDATAPCTDQSSDCDGNASTDVVTDNLTGLMWTRNGNIRGDEVWYVAIDYANNLTLCGYSDWWLPNVNELESLINADVANTASWLNTQGFYNVKFFQYYWSSTTYAGYTYGAWVVSMWGGYVSHNGKDSSLYYVWPVRSGQ